MIAPLNNCLAAKTSRAIFIHLCCLYSDATTSLNQLPVQEIPGLVETKPLWEFDQTLSQRSDWVKGMTRETIRDRGQSQQIQDCSDIQGQLEPMCIILVLNLKKKTVLFFNELVILLYVK